MIFFIVDFKNRLKISTFFMAHFVSQTMEINTVLAFFSLTVKDLRR